jgi:hypothetical protein
MKFLSVVVCVLLIMQTHAQVTPAIKLDHVSFTDPVIQTNTHEISLSEDIRIERKPRWKMTGNHYLTGGLVFLSGAAKGFNEALHYQYKGFESIFPEANDQWFYPPMSFKNKYKDGDPQKGAKFPLSTSVLVMLTDQYHLNNFIHRSALTAALVIKVGEGKKPWRYYLFDALFYTVCYQAGFHAVYTPIQVRNGK